MTDNRIRYEDPETGIARIVLARPETRNSQDTRMLYELNDAFDQAARDDTVKVIILAADGPHFSSGHDLRENPDGAMDDHRTVGTWCGFGCAGAEGHMAREKEIYLGLLGAVAQRPQTHHRRGAGQGHRGRTDAGVAVRHRDRRR